MQMSSPSVTDVVLWGTAVGVPSLIGLAYRSLVGKLKSIDEKQDQQTVTLSNQTSKMDRWEVALFGITGNNGINGTVKTLRDDVDELMDRRKGPIDRRHSA
jgi:hypothetical protein